MIRYCWLLCLTVTFVAAGKANKGLKLPHPHHDCPYATCNLAPEIQKSFCASHFVIRIQVLSRSYTIDTLTVRYKIFVDNVFVSRNVFYNIRKQKYLYTPNIYRCGHPNLQPKKYYLVSGNIIKKQMTLDYCKSFVQEVAAPSWNSDHLKYLQQHLQWDFKSTCGNGCIIDSCTSPTDCANKDSRNHCIYFILRKECVSFYSVCERRDGVCKWREVNGFKRFDECDIRMSFAFSHRPAGVAGW